MDLRRNDNMAPAKVIEFLALRNGPSQSPMLSQIKGHIELVYSAEVYAKIKSYGFTVTRVEHESPSDSDF
ncbi:hypothetical protein BOTBODRAFT_445314 [Botryobasidium botryosum FD-172 SS1]|uniref:Uncharacterized protein n=1 Tax=Botryobasidium botryosum (strain FD-172 SS1) TaxID=930990 RepID=A0A067N6B1_BOTB1|nr:hypothetical protein BOTBODRAFT_445314 [Botryobasidium botryosum FD-172 SS1]